MKKSEIKIGAVYSNGRGRERKVIDRGDYPIVSCQTDHDCVLYEIIKDGTKRNQSAGKRSEMTAASFANWAKKEVKDV